MFSALRLGSVLYILEKGDLPQLKIGLVTSVSLPTYSNNYLMNGSTVNISTKVGDLVMEFLNIPGNLSTASLNNVIIAETKELMSNEVDNMLQSSKNIVDSMAYHEKVIESCENILRDLNPRFAKEKERDEDISNLKVQLGGLENKMDKLLLILSDKK